MTTKKHIQKKIAFYKEQIKQLDKPHIFHGKKFAGVKLAEMQIRIEELENVLSYMEKNKPMNFFKNFFDLIKFRKMTKNLNKGINSNHKKHIEENEKSSQ